MNPPEKSFHLIDLFLRSWHPYMWFVLIPFLLYAQVLTFSEYTHYDDYFLIVENYTHINSFSTLGRAFLEDVGHQGQGGNLYRPLLTISFMLSAQVSGVQPFGYHLFDILLHAACCCLLFYLLQLLGYQKKFAFFGTMLFCVHPALTQAVAWIAGRNDSLLAVFILLGFISAIHFFSTHQIKWYLVHLLCFACALFTKESAILFPLMVLMYAWTLRRDKIFSLYTLLLLTGWITTFINWHILRSASMVVPVGNTFQAASTVLSNSLMAVFYFGKIFWPFSLAFAPVANDAHLIAGSISLAGLGLALLFSKRREWNVIIFGILWFLAFLLPTFYYDISVHTPPKFYEHRIYVPCMGIMFILLSLTFQNGRQSLKRIATIATTITICVLFILSYRHTSDFKNSLMLGEYDAATSPNDLRPYKEITRMTVPNDLAAALRARSESLQAHEANRFQVTKEDLWCIIDSLQVQMKLNAHDPELLQSLAVAAFARGYAHTSEENFLAAFRKTPTNAIIPYNLGILYYSAHAGEKAEHAWLQALQLDPSMGKAHLNLSYWYYESGHYDAAWDHCQQALHSGVEIPQRFIQELQRMRS
jgi:hypothetical protein